MSSSHRITSVPFVAFAIVLVTALIASGGLSALASSQDDQSGGPYPAHIHSGTCDELGGVEFPLSDAAAPEGDQEGTAPSVAVSASTTVVETTLDDLLTEPHAVNVHMSADDMGTYVACGDIGGVVVDDELVIGLTELNDSGLSGIGILTDSDEGLEVSFYLTQSGDAGATPTADDAEGSPAAGSADAADAMSEEVTVEIVDFAYGEGTLEVAVGTTVRWVNNDSVPHTVTSTPGGKVFQSDKLDQGDEFTFTFTEAGTYEYFCEYHGNLSGTVIVT